MTVMAKVRCVWLDCQKKHPTPIRLWADPTPRHCGWPMVIDGKPLTVPAGNGDQAVNRNGGE